MKSLLLKLPPWTLTVVVVTAVLYLTLAPDPLPDIDTPMWEHTDKVVHAIMMLGVAWGIGLDMMRASRTELRRLPGRVLLTIAVVTALFGGGVELLQSAMQMGRSADIVDFGADTVGALAGCATLPLWVHLR